MGCIIFIGNIPYLERLDLGQRDDFTFVFYSDALQFIDSNTQKDDIKAIAVCEWYNGSPTSTLLENILLLRHFGYGSPIIVLSFLTYEQLKKVQSDILSSFSEDNSHQFLRLPVAIEELISAINQGQGCDNPKALPFVVCGAGKSVIDHALGRRDIHNLSLVSDLPEGGLIKKYVKFLVFNILLLDDDATVLKEVEWYLEQYKKGHPELDIEINLITIQNSNQVENLILDGGKNIQCVLLDWMLKQGDTNQKLKGKELVDLIQNKRPELPIYIFSQSDDGISILKSLRKTKNVGFFTKKQIKTDPNSVFGKIIHQYKKRCKSPFWEAYKQYVDSSTDTWHTPGHSRGASFRKSPYLLPFYNYFGENMFAADLSVSVEELGSLLDSTAYIKKAQEKAAKTFGSKYVFFATNGSSTSNKVIIQTMLRPGDGVIVDRNCHKSVHYGVIQAGAMPFYMNSEFDNDLRIFAPPSIAEIEKKIKEAKGKAQEMGINLKAIIITGCTYDGMLINVKKVVKIAHEANLKVFIDEAWFAYSGFHPNYREYSAIHSGADYVTHSAHKVLSAFSQASYIHVNDPDFNEDFFREIFYIYTSTSPQYNIIASLDVAATQMEMEGFSILDELIKNAQYFREGCKTFQHIKLVESTDFQAKFKNLQDDNVGFDPLKVLINIEDLGYNEKYIHEFLLSEGGLEIEKTTSTTILVLFTIGTTSDKIFRLFAALKALDDDNVNSKKRSRSTTTPNGKKPNLEVDLKGLPSLAFFSHDKVREQKKLEELINSEDKYVSVNLVTPYPPGIPYMIPNQALTDDIVEELIALKNNGTEIHGCHDGKIWVAKNNDINNK